jgi:hypothetical protein
VAEAVADPSPWTDPSPATDPSPGTDPSPTVAHISFVELDADLAVVASRTGDPGLRAPDGIHLASAFRIATRSRPS